MYFINIEWISSNNIEYIYQLKSSDFLYHLTIRIFQPILTHSFVLARSSNHTYLVCMHFVLWITILSLQQISHPKDPTSIPWSLTNGHSHSWKLPHDSFAWYNTSETVSSISMHSHCIITLLFIFHDHDAVPSSSSTGMLGLLCHAWYDIILHKLKWISTDTEMNVLSVTRLKLTRVTILSKKIKIKKKLQWNGRYNTMILKSEFWKKKSDTIR